MSFPPDERREREMVGASQPTNRIPQEKEKTDKTKSLSSQGGGTVADSSIYQRQLQHQPGKPLQNMPIAPAAGAMASMSLSNQFPPNFGSGSAMQSYGLPAHAIMGHGQMPRAPMVMSAIPHQHAYVPHVPRGPAAAAMAGAAPRSVSTSRKPTIPTAAKPQGLATSQPGSQASTVHAPVPTSSSQSQPPVVSSTQRLVASAGPVHLDTKQSDTQDCRPPGVMDKPRRTASPHTQTLSIHSTVSSTHQSLSAASKPVTVTSSVSLNSASQKQAQSAIAVATHQGQGSVAASSSASSMTSLPSLGTTGPPVMAQSKFLPSGTISVTPAILSLGKGYPAQHPMAFQATRQPLSSSESGMAGDHGRLGKPSGTASPISVSTHHVSMVSTAPLVSSTIQSTVVGSDSRMDRPYPSISLPGQFAYQGLYYSDPLSGYTHAPALHQFPQFPPSFPPLPSIVRTPQTTTAAAVAAAHAAAAAAAGVSPMLMDPRLLALQQQGAGGMGALGGDSSAAGGMMDGNVAAGIYSGSALLGLQQQQANLQPQISANNPNATSPRPSILRKRTSEGMRKSVSQLPLIELSSASQVEAAASPKSESTVSAPQSAQNSPKPASDSGGQATEQSVPAITTGTNIVTVKVEQAKAQQPQPVSPKIKRESNESSVLSSSSVKSNGVNSFVSSSVHLPPSIAVPVDGASPRKKPRKQNVVATEDKFGSSAALEMEATDDEDKKAKQDEDDELKFIILKRPKISIFGGYKMNTKAAHNHFQKYSDVKVKEERRPSLQDVANSKGIVQRANGWRIQHCAAQIDELAQVEQEVLKKMCEFRESIPKPKPGHKTKFQDELGMLHELLQGNIQRSQLVIEQLSESRKSMTRVLDHRPKVVDMLSKYINKRNPKKKS